MAARRARSANTVVENRVSSMSKKIASRGLLTAGGWAESSRRAAEKQKRPGARCRRPDAGVTPRVRLLALDVAADVGDPGADHDHQAAVLVGGALLLEEEGDQRQ